MTYHAPIRRSHRPLRHKRYVLVLLIGPLGFGMLAGCSHAGTINIIGSYFPVWLLCMIAGIAAALGLRVLLVRTKIEPYVGPLTLIYLCTVVGTSCLLWLLFA